MKATDPSASVFRIRNLRAAALWLLVAVAGVGFIILRSGGLQLIAAGVIIVFALQASFVFWQGVTLGPDGTTFPRALHRVAPVLVFGRSKIKYPRLRDLTAVGPFLEFDVVWFSTDEKVIAVLFGTRAQKLAFFDAIMARQPGIRIYRAV